MSNGDAFVLTHNAKYVIEKNFKGVDIFSLYLEAKVLGKKSKVKRQIREFARARDIALMIDGFKGRYFKATSCGVVFVMAVPEICITIFRLKDRQHIGKRFANSKDQAQLPLGNISGLSR
ncbi:hypothetical protein [Methylobacillus sp. Pita1]|uniref:hypothetical protein n=1 Tax=Methylobacillus sp. Pita1 TaxID=3382642 RepID=UPI0038B5BA44